MYIGVSDTILKARLYWSLNLFFYLFKMASKMAASV